jgi:hypothetical protein
MKPLVSVALTLAIAGLTSCVTPTGVRTVPIRTVDIPVSVQAEFPWPAHVKSVRVTEATTPESVKTTAPGACALLGSHVEALLLKSFPRVQFKSSAAIAAILKKNPQAKLPAVDAMLTVRLNGVSILQADGGGVAVDAAVVLRLIDNRDGSVLFVTDLTDRFPFIPARPVPLPEVRNRAIASAMETAAKRCVAKLTGGTRVERVFLLDAGPVTGMGIASAAAGNLEAAKAKFLEATALYGERSPAYYNLATLCRLQGKEAEAEGYRRKAEGVGP